MAVLFSTAALVLTGCGMGPQTTAPDAINLSFAGSVHGGQQPVSFSNVALFATASAGYGGTLTPIATTQTNAAGEFAFTSAGNCPSGQQAYIVAAGGNPGLTAGVDNSAIFLVAALGPCTGIGAGTLIDINEVTTVAAAYALSGFLPSGGLGMTEAAVVAGTAMPGVTTSSTNVQGLTDAFANANNIVNTVTGLAYTATPTANSTGVVPQSIIHALADILQVCVNSTGPTSTACASVNTGTPTNGVLTVATPPTGSGVATPLNVWQAAIDIAQYPGNNVAALFGLVSSQPAFPTSLASAPSDWTVGITYTASNMVTPLGMVIDNSDNVYVTGSYQKTPLIDEDLLEFSPQGATTNSDLVTPASLPAATQNVRTAAFDLSSNLWMSDGAAAGVYEYVPGNSTATEYLYSAAPASNTDANNYAIAVDQDGDVWTSSYKKDTCATTTKICELVEFAKGATIPYTPYATFGGNTVLTPGVGGSRGIAYDVLTNNIWITDITESDVQLFKVTPSTTGAATSSTAATTIAVGATTSAPATYSYGAEGVAIDKASNAWIVVTGGPAVTTGTTTNAVSAALYEINSAGSILTTNGLTGGGLSAPSYLAIDGNNNVFVANTGASTSLSTVVEYSPGFNANAGAFLSSNLGFLPSSTFASGTYTGGSIYQGTDLAIDRAGALWVLSSGATPGTNGSVSVSNLVQILGVAAPVNPIFAAGKYGVKP